MTFEIDKGSQKEFEQFLKKAAELPRKRLSHAAKEGAKISLEKTKDILNSNSDKYKMRFPDGNTWEKKDIEKNLTIKLEKGKRKQKRVARIKIKDWRVSKYSNFVEYGYTNPKSDEEHKALHFMRDGLTKTKNKVEDVMIEDLRKSLDKLK